MARAPVSKTGYWGSSPCSPAICTRAAVGETEPTQNRLRKIHREFESHRVYMPLRTNVAWVRNANV